MTLAPGTRLGPYQIESSLGAGGMGRVYRARDTRLERQVAIKLLTGPAGGDTADRLLREARSASALNHPNICTLHEIGEAEGTSFIVMELVEGEALDRRITDSGLPLAAVVRLGRQIAEGLAHAHARGIIHRDLKSANVAVTTDGRAKILDFGIAKRVSPTELTDATRSVATLTADNEIAGTLPYMAPELLEGRPAGVTSDLWALGVMLVEMATGSRPFRGATGLALSTAILRDPPDIPASITPPLEGIVRKLLARNPGDRFQSAAAVAAELERIDASAAAASSTSRTPRRRMPLLVAGVTTALLVIAGATWWSLSGGGPEGASDPAPIGSIAVLPLDNQSPEADQQYFADGMTEALISQLSAIEDLRVISRTSVMQFKETTKPLREIAEALGVDGVVEGAILQTAESVRITARLIDARSEQQVWRGEYEKPLSDAIGLQREIASTIGREIRGELTEADTERLSRRTDVDPAAFQSYLRGRFHWNLRNTSDLLQAAKLFEDAIARDPDFALAHAGLADVYVLLGDFRDMLPAEAYGRARQAVETALRLDPSLAEAHTTRAWLAFVDRDWKAAESGFNRALQLNAGYATAQQWHGEFLAALGRFDEAFAALRRARQLDPLALMPQAIHGWVAYLAGRYDEAVDLCEDVLARNPGFRPARMYRAWSWMEQKKLDEAERDITALLQISSSKAVPIATLGRISARRGDAAGARRAIEDLQALPYPPSFDIAKLHAELRQRDEVLAWLARAEAERNSAVLYINVDRAFVWLRGDPGFEALLVTLNLK